ncbi:hypothetical protein [Compostibacter hankyongensis]|uniref:Helix-turn-helix domain-containing protein n=1 Tax=Compostibacter hankyongensis TaxID=1007089 RepID=A0ABP8FUS0_9BACT
MLDTLISSRTRLKLLLRLFLNPGSTAHLRGLAGEFEESSNAVRIELNRFTDAGMLVSESQGNKRIYKANIQHPFYKDIHRLLLKYVGIDHIIEEVIGRLGDVLRVYLTGDYAAGRDSGIIDLILVGRVDRHYLSSLVDKAEPLIQRKVRFLTYEEQEWSTKYPVNPGRDHFLLLWEKEE